MIYASHIHLILLCRSQKITHCTRIIVPHSWPKILWISKCFLSSAVFIGYLVTLIQLLPNGILPATLRVKDMLEWGSKIQDCGSSSSGAWKTLVNNCSPEETLVGWRINHILFMYLPPHTFFFFLETGAGSLANTVRMRKVALK